MKLNLLFILLLFTVLSCDKIDYEIDGIPNCVSREIRADNGDWQRVFERRIDGEQFFYFQAGCCDRFNELFDTNCNRICSPDGGFTGGGDGQCPDFTNAVIADTQIWERE